MKVYLDDERPTPAGWVGARWPEDAIRLLEAGGVTEISLDHDLGDDERGTGYTVLLWIEEAVATRGFVPPHIHINTANASARSKMLLGVASIERLARRSTREPDA
ncbi:MAG: cyclic-phosphate processing receiver domain-containing protein [Planctomycetota bacterium]